jgi:hypothetical protein
VSECGREGRSAPSGRWCTRAAMGTATVCVTVEEALTYILTMHRLAGSRAGQGTEEEEALGHSPPTLPAAMLSSAQDEMRGWDISEVVFTPAMWPIYQPLLRADCTLFDSYVHKPLQPPVMSPGAAHAADSSTGLRPGISGVTTADSVSCSGIAGDRAGTPAGTPSASVDGPMSACCSAPADTQPSTQLGGGGPSDVGEAPFPGLPIFAWWGGRDRRVSKELVHGWSRFTSGPFQMTCMPGGTHLWPLDPALKPQWLKELVGHLESLGLGNE